MLNLSIPPHILATVYNGNIIGIMRSQVNDPRIEQQISVYFQDLLKEMGYIEYSNAIVHTFQRFRAPFSEKIVHIFPEQSAVI